MADLLARIADVFHLELLLQLVLAILLGGAIGLERELSGKPAGLRTNVLICVGATLFTALSVTLSLGRGDPARIAAQILPGVGFIGAGTILHTRGSVTGLTSAATIWVVAAIGMALGAHAYEAALGTALLVLVVLQGLRWVEDLVARASSRSRLLVHAKPEPTALEDLEALVRRTGLEIERAASRHENVDLVIELELRGPKRLHDQVLVGVLHHPGVRTVSTGE
ncbi:MAG TPA: MgtC/SapB family protein [Gemmatimonadales bacterium]|nr:MgtC/SapB family protein [Gemmatimonadales bacterium]